MFVRYLVWFLCWSVVQADTLTNDVDSRIQMGDSVYTNELPFMVSLQLFENFRHFCSGAIVSWTWVVTAAGCTENDEIPLFPEQIEVITGILLNAPWSRHQVTYIRRHETYIKSDSAIRDIALLKVTPAFEFNDFVAPALLPLADLHVPAGTKAVVAGWGSITYPNLTIPARLQKLDVTVVSENYCKESYMKVLQNIYTAQLCTHETTGVTRGTCQGDLGGPLIIDGNVLIGIVSWSYKNGTCGTYPTVYTKLSKFVYWLKLSVIYE